MSRVNVAKGRNDKGGKGVSAPTPHQAIDIVPGKFTDLDWYSLLDHDDSDDFISDIIDEVCDNAMGIIHKNYLDNQLIPYNVDKARRAIVHLIQWQFLAGDKGEEITQANIGWGEDREPEPCTTDCWAQGSVPRKLYTPRPETPLEQVTEETTEEIEASVGLPTLSEEPTMVLESPSEPPFGGIEHERTIIDDENSLIIEGTAVPLQPTPSALEEEEAKPKKKKFKPYTGKIKSAGVSRMVESLHDSETQLLEKEYMEEVSQTSGPPQTPDRDSLLMPQSMQSIIKLQGGRPPGNRDVMFDQNGAVLNMSKISPMKLPTNRIKTRFSIVDPEVEAAKARLEAMRTGKYVNAQSSKLLKRQPGGNHPFLKHGMSPLPPPLIEAIDVVPGVIVRENERVKKGTRIRHEDMDLIERALKTGLRPVVIKNNRTLPPTLQTNTPIIKPMDQPYPIPPISQQ